MASSKQSLYTARIVIYKYMFVDTNVRCMNARSIRKLYTLHTHNKFSKES